MPTTIYILNYIYSPNTQGQTDGFSNSSAYSTLELAQTRANRDRNKELNPTFAWKHFDTDQEGVEMWNTSYKLHGGGTGYITITKYPLDASPTVY